MTQFKDQASTNLRVKYYNPTGLIFQNLSVKHVIVHGKRYKDDNRSRNGYIIQILTNNDFDEIAEMCRKIGKIYEGIGKNFFQGFTN